jgi:hypothetical protein
MRRWYRWPPFPDLLPRLALVPPTLPARVQLHPLLPLLHMFPPPPLVLLFSYPRPHPPIMHAGHIKAVYAVEQCI